MNRIEHGTYDIEKEIKLAICYDFDKTLTPDDMQAQGFIQSLDYKVEDFWATSNAMAAKNEMDQNLSYMFMMTEESKGKVVFTRDSMKKAGAKIRFFEGVTTWFDRIDEYGKERGIVVEHFIISSGLKEMIEGSAIADKFKRIYASSFTYDHRGIPVWPAQAVNYTNKTQFLFRIEKGILDVNDQNVNAYFEPHEYDVPFRNMVYIGDSDTDIPCMKLVNANGGHSIGVYNPETKDKSKVFRMLDEGRIKFFAPADYSEDSPMDRLIKQIIDRTYANELLEKMHYRCKAEKYAETRGQTREEAYKEGLIDALEDSINFRSTHSAIRELSAVESWSRAQKRKLCNIALENGQVRSILKDNDLKQFYSRICEGLDDAGARAVLTLLQESEGGRIDPVR